MTVKTISVRYLARVEGEGALYLKIEGGTVTDARLKIFEPPRFFEALLRGRMFDEAPDITSRICGICPIAYQMSSVHAMERALGLILPDELRMLRRILYCGEWIESHALHVFMLHAPDFMGYPSAVAMAQDHPDFVKQGLAIKKAGNRIMTLLGGREVHPINVRVGGFYKVPSVAAISALVSELEAAKVQTENALNFVLSFDYPDLERGYELVALRSRDEYPMIEGRVASSAGLDVDPDEFEAMIEEHQMPHTNALHARIKGRGPYLCGPLARFALNYDRLPNTCRQFAEKAGIAGGTTNPYKSIIVRLIEIHFAIDEATRLIAALKPPARPAVPASARAATGRAATEAPRGLLFHRYELAADGRIVEARIVPPTSQNQASIEADLREVVMTRLSEAADENDLRHLCERLIRNHDPCISCATHFLDIKRIEAGSWSAEQEG